MEIPLPQPTPVADIKALLRCFTNRSVCSKLEDEEAAKCRPAEKAVKEVHLKDEHEDAAYVEPLPSKKYGRFYRNIRWTFLNVYERLAFLVLSPNLAVMIYLLCQPGTFNSPTKLSTPVAANLTMTVAIRNEHIINFLFWSFGKTPKSVPLRI